MNIMGDFNDECGYLELVSGPMYSGKTSRLLNLYKQFKFCGIPTLVLNHADDAMRYSVTHLSNHDQEMIPCMMINSLKDVMGKEFLEARVILINEIQFFQNDTVEWIRTAVDVYHKHVYVCGLDGDFQRRKFGNWLEELIPLCDNHVKLHSYCSQCKRKNAIFTHRLTKETEQKIIGTECYIPLCRGCYNKLNVL